MRMKQNGVAELHALPFFKLTTPASHYLNFPVLECDFCLVNELKLNLLIFSASFAKTFLKGHVE